jgi:flagellar biosynthesis GTPase FlhF
VLSKTDETESAAAVLALLRARGLPVSWIGCGQMVPDDLLRATGRLLTGALLGEPLAAPAAAEVPCA